MGDYTRNVAQLPLQILNSNSRTTMQNPRQKEAYAKEVNQTTLSARLHVSMGSSITSRIIRVGRSFISDSVL